MLNISLHKRKWFRCWIISYGMSNIKLYILAHKKQENEIQKWKLVQKRYTLCRDNCGGHQGIAAYCNPRFEIVCKGYMICLDRSRSYRKEKFCL